MQKQEAGLGHSVEQLLRSGLEIEPRILMGLVTGNCSDALHEVEDALGLAALLGEYRLDDLRGLRFPKAALAQEFGSLIIGARDDALARGLDAIDEGHWRGVGKPRERRRRLMGKPGGRIFRVTNGDLLEILDTPEIAVLANRAKVKARYPERLGADLRIPAIEAAEVEIGRTVRQFPGLDRIQVVDQKKKYISIRGVQRRGAFRDVDLRIIDAGRPVEHTRHLPARITGAVAGDPLHGGNQFMVVDAPVVGAGDRAQFNTPVFDFERFDQFGAEI